MKRNKKEVYNQIRSGQLWKSTSEGLAKGKIIKIIGRNKRGFWKTTRIDNRDTVHRVPTHSIREHDLLKYYVKI